MIMAAARSSAADGATGSSTVCGGIISAVGFVGRDVLGQFEMHRARPLLLRDAEGVANQGRDALRALTIWRRHLGQRPHGRDDVDDLEARLPAAPDRLLAGEHHHRHRAEMRVGRACRQVERAGTERGQADARPSGQPPIGRRHEAGGLLVPRQHQLDLRAPQRLDARRGSPRRERRRCIRRPRSRGPRPGDRRPWSRGSPHPRFRFLRPVRQRPVRPDEVAGVTVRIFLQIILMLGLRLPERPDGRHLGDDLARPQAGSIDVGDGVFRDPLLLVIGVEDGRPIARRPDRCPGGSWSRDRGSGKRTPAACDS